MYIKNISSTNNEVTITLDSEELTTLCNMMYFISKENKMDSNITFHTLYANITMLRNLSQYGIIDSFAFERIKKEREKAHIKEE